MKWADVYLHLKNKGISVYSPGQKNGICKNRYVVVKDNGTYSKAESNKLGYSILDVIIYYPMDKYSQIEGFKEQIKSYMKELQGIKFTGSETPVIIDTKVNAYTTSIEYQVLKRL